jgi:hypothetical protein
MFRSIAAIGPRRVGALAASIGPLLKHAETHYLKSTPLSMCFCTLLLEGTPANDQNNCRRTVHTMSFFQCPFNRQKRVSTSHHPGELLCYGRLQLLR